MKRIITLSLLCFKLSFSAQTAPSCSLDPVFIAANKNGIFPDSVTNFVQGTVGIPYGQNITVKVPKDTISLGITFCFNRVELSSPSNYTNFNLPPGLNLLGGNTVTTTTSIYKYPGNANSCSIIWGTPTVAGTYTVQFKVQPFLSTGFSGCPAAPNYTSGSGSITSPTQLSYYIIKINPSSVTSFKEAINLKSIGLMNTPNPFSGKTTIKFNVKDESIVKIFVYNILGDKVLEEKIKPNLGENNYELNATNWPNGVYLYTISYQNYSETKRMILNNLNE
jgi:hypothetical protein